MSIRPSHTSHTYRSVVKAITHMDDALSQIGMLLKYRDPMGAAIFGGDRSQFSSQLRVLAATRPVQPSFWDRYRFLLTVVISTVLFSMTGGLLVFFHAIDLPLWAGILIGVGAGTLVGYLIASYYGNRNVNKGVPVSHVKIEEVPDSQEALVSYVPTPGIAPKLAAEETEEFEVPTHYHVDEPADSADTSSFVPPSSP